LFGNVVYSCTRADALADGSQIDVSETAREAGIAFPVYMTREVWDLYVTIPNGVRFQDEDSRRWDILWMLRFGISMASDPKASTLIFSVHVRNTNSAECEPPAVQLKAVVGPTDIHAPAPALTIMLPEQD
jgi:hypothetical protein